MKTSEKPADTPPWLRSFRGLVALHFQGALSETIYRFAVMMLVMAHFRGADDGYVVSRWQGVIALMTAIPFIGLAGWCGKVADKFSRNVAILATKTSEIILMLLGGIAMFFCPDPATSSSWPIHILIVILLLLACQRAFYSAASYALLPDMLPRRKLSWGNGILGMAGFSGFFIGLFLGGLFYFLLERKGLWPLSLGLVGLGLIGLGSGWFIRSVNPARPNIKLDSNPLGDLWFNIKILLSDRMLILSVIGLSYFWTFVSIALVNTPIWGHHDLGMEMPGLRLEAPLEFASRFNSIFGSSGIMLAPVALGIGIGCLIAGRMSRRSIEIGFVPLGGLGIALFSLPLGLAAPGRTLTADITMASPAVIVVMMLFLLMMSISAGCFMVPLHALLQQEARSRFRGGTIAAANFCIFCMVVFGLITFTMVRNFFGFTAANVFTLNSVITFGATIYMITLVPEALLGLVSTVIARFIYRVRVIGRDNIPRNGPALLVANHVSLLDALLIMFVSPRPVRFIVWNEIFDNPVLGYFLKIMKAIPVSADQRPRALIESLRHAADALNEGDLVCIFTQGQMTRSGLALPYQRGFRHILKQAPVPVVPVYLAGVWGSIFSYERKKYVWSWPRQFPYFVQVAIGKPMGHDAPLSAMHQSVTELSAECALAQSDIMKPVHHRFIRHARRHKRDFCVIDSLNKEGLPFFKVLVGGIILARRFRKQWKDQEMVGVFLPPSIGGVVANVAVTLSGRVAVNLNYTTGREVLDHCIKECNIKTILTSKIFLARLGIKDLPGAIYLEEIKAEKKPPQEMAISIVTALALPPRAVEFVCGAYRHPKVNDLFTVIFSSGSTGVPKGVMLTHFNIASNIESIEKSVSLWRDDVVIGFLPFFHSFGYTVCLWGSLNIGYGLVHHANPLEAKVIGDLVEQYKCTVMVATPTFLQHYTRRVEPEKFNTLEYILTGAEKLPLRVAEAFEERFGHYVYEGYGTTECAPVVSANIDDYRSRGHYQHSNRRGTVGHPFTGIAVRICDLDTGEPLPAGERGMIKVRGGNIMAGYLNLPDKTAEVLKNGWYETGDVGYVDEEGFIHITDRLSRFSKIGGEMVPHLRIEDELHNAIGATEQVLAVTSVPDEAKGERLIVLHVEDDTKFDKITEKLTEAGMPNLWIPRRTNFYRIEAIPVLGSGKLDLAAVRRMAHELTGAKTAEETSKPDPKPAAKSAPKPSAKPAAKADPEPQETVKTDGAKNPESGAEAGPDEENVPDSETADSKSE